MPWMLSNRNMAYNFFKKSNLSILHINPYSTVIYTNPIVNKNLSHHINGNVRCITSFSFLSIFFSGNK